MVDVVLALLLLLSGDVETNPGPGGQQLTVDDLRALMKELNDVRAKWYNIGVQLGVSVGTLDAIEKQYSDPSDCLRKTITTWLQTCSPPLTWTNIVGALSVVSEATLAADLEHKYCPSRPAPPIPVTSQLTAPQPSPITGDCTPPDTSPTATTPPPNPEQIGPTTPHTVEHQVKDFETKFGSLIDEARQKVGRKMKPSTFLSRITYLPVSDRTLHRSFIEDKLINIPPPVTMDKIWTTLNLYWDFLNYGLLEHVIQKCGSENLKQQMQKYIHELSMFKKTTRLCDFIKSRPCRDDGPPEDQLKKVVIKMKHEWSQCTLQDVESFKKALVHKFFLEEFDMSFKKAEMGCVCVTWLTSPSIATLLQQNLANIVTEFFNEHGIDAIAIDHQDINLSFKLKLIGGTSVSGGHSETTPPSLSEQVIPQAGVVHMQERMMEADALLQDPQLQEAIQIGKDFKSSIESCLAVRETTLENLRKLKRETEESYDKSRKARIGGTVATITGATIGIVGFGLSFVTFGASLGLTIAGGILAVGGGVTVSGAEIGNFTVSKTHLKNAQAAYDTDREATEKVKRLCERFTSCIKSLQTKHSRFSEEHIRRVVIYMVKVRGPYSAYKLIDVAWDVSRNILTAVEIAKAGAQVGARTAWTGFSTAGRVVSGVSVAVNLVLIPIDLAVLIKSAYDVRKYKRGKGSNSAAAKKIGELIESLEQNLVKIQEELREEGD